jgi:hypothetical protein
LGIVALDEMHHNVTFVRYHKNVSRSTESGFVSSQHHRYQSRAIILFSGERANQMEDPLLLQEDGRAKKANPPARNNLMPSEWY